MATKIFTAHWTDTTTEYSVIEYEFGTFFTEEEAKARIEEVKKGINMGNNYDEYNWEEQGKFEIVETVIGIPVVNCVASYVE